MSYKDKMLLQDFILFLDLENGTYTIPCYGVDKYAYLFENNDYDTVLKKIYDLFVVEQDKEKLINTLSFNAIKIQLEKDESSEISIDFRLNIDEKKEYWISTVVKRLKLAGPSNENFAIISSYNINEYKILQQKDEEHQLFLKHLETSLSETYEYIYDIDFKKGYQIRICANKNEQDNKLLKRDNDDVQNKVTENLIHPDDLDEYIKHGSAPAIIKAFKEGKKGIYYETRTLYNDGTYHWNSIDIKRIDTGNEDDIRAFCFIKDIDEKKKIENIKNKAEEEKRQIDEKYKNYLNLIADNVDDVILIFDEKDPNPLFVSGNIKRILGIGYYDILKLFDINDDIGDKAILKFYKKYDVNRKKYFEKEILIKHPINKEEKWICLKNYPVVIDDDNKRHIILISDLTNKKAQEQLLHEALKSADYANQAKSKFLSHMSHEIRTPMNAIIGMTEIAKANIDNKEKVYDCMTKLDNASKYLLYLINNILDMSKIENGQTVVDNKPFNLDEVLSESIDIIEQLTNSKKQNLFIKNTVNNYELIGDKVGVLRILINILSNSSKFTPENGKIEFEISERNNTNDKITICFRIKDNGIGMEESFIEKIYDPFTQEKRDYILNNNGTGLGMSISKNLVLLMGGNIYVSSELGKGTEFVVEIPFLKSFNYIKADTDLNDYNFNFCGKKILIAEDNELNLEIAKELLEMAGFEVDTAVNGIEAIQKFNEKDENYYDGILLDILMPEMDGYEACRKIRKSEKIYGATIPIIAMTANTNDSDIAKSFECGMNIHISKPINRITLYQTLYDIFRN